MCVSSPSLECDSEEDDMLGNTYPCSSLKQSSIFQSSSGEERDSIDTSPELNRTLSDSTHQSTQVSPICTPFLYNSKSVINSIINVVIYIMLYYCFKGKSWDGQLCLFSHVLLYEPALWTPHVLLCSVFLSRNQKNSRCACVLTPTPPPKQSLHGHS